MPTSSTIVGLGEALFDVFPDAERLGGAPLNVAVHAHQLLSQSGGHGVVVTRIGQDNRGQQVMGELKDRGMTTDFVQQDPDKPTGVVYVDTTDPTSPDYEIVADVAWDWLHYDPDLETLARQCDAVCFGTLAQRTSEARSSIHRFLKDARKAIRLLDLNLRQDFYSARIIERSLELANALKLNDEELPVLCGLLGRDAQGEASEQLAEIVKIFDLKWGILTRGEAGTLLVDAAGKVHAAQPVSAKPVEEADSVGAGDACAAAVLVGLLARKPLPAVAQFANEVGAFVAGQPGATPTLPESLCQRA